MHEMIRKFYLLPNFLSLEDKRYYLNNYTMVSFVRHPFVRLASTYKNKVLDLGIKDWRNMVNYDDKNPYGVCNKMILR